MLEPVTRTSLQTREGEERQELVLEPVIRRGKAGTGAGAGDPFEGQLVSASLG